MSDKDFRPVLLVIRDGWGENHNSSQDKYNAIKIAHTPVSDRLSKEWPRTEIQACGLSVGLPEGVMGNSEVGHQNIGAGRVVDQEIVRINKAMSSGSIKDKEELVNAIKYAKERKKRIHFMGLVSDAGVHSMLDHLYGLLECVKERGVEEAYIHAFTDGRDTPPKSGLGYIKALEARCEAMGIGKIASVSGRFWAMDRDHRWDRVERAYNCLIGKSWSYAGKTAGEIVENYYKNPIDETRVGDEFVLPSCVVDEGGKPVGPIEFGDCVIFFNFRGDRPRELTRAFIDVGFKGFDRGQLLGLHYVTLTEYEKGLCEHVIFRKPAKMVNILADYVSQQGIKQFRCAETEKYPHVTFFFNDYREEPFEGEDRKMIPSPKEVPTYDLKPEMSAEGVCEATREAILSKKYGLLVVNFANTDMVGHTGSLEATVKAVEVVDACLGKLLEAIDEVNGIAVIMADHGNADQMWDESAGVPHTQHTLNPVEVLVYGKGMNALEMQASGKLGDIAPTILSLMKIQKPVEMKGVSLIV